MRPNQTFIIRKLLTAEPDLEFSWFPCSAWEPGEFFVYRGLHPGNDDRHSGAGRNPERAVSSCATFWTPACAGVTELPILG